MEEKIALPPFGGTFGGIGGLGKSISPVACSVGLRDSPLSTRSPYRVYSFSGVRHVCHDNDGRFVHADPVSQVTSIKAKVKESLKTFPVPPTGPLFGECNSMQKIKERTFNYLSETEQYQQASCFHGQYANPTSHFSQTFWDPLQ